MIDQNTLDTINGYYEAYRKLNINEVKESDGFGKGIESVCNHKEMIAIIDSMPQAVMDDGKWMGWTLEQMKARVGEKGLR
jgi:hypothetical protein